ncbi:hypothetical protein N7463_010449 [Penicillium fimorum]|uniref:Phytanoyl-CoA dioxygenase n=1 Tax=Penicillium fimorum TaxID=1882269 RepID=A0A9X0C1B8_9EURO|nr:hypothetical protein N7463_010449 [Penicillium fimorum]
MVVVDGFLMLGSCYHCGSANTTTDQERLMFVTFMVKGFMLSTRSSSIPRPRRTSSGIAPTSHSLGGWTGETTNILFAAEEDMHKYPVGLSAEEAAEVKNQMAESEVSQDDIKVGA